MEGEEEKANNTYVSKLRFCNCIFLIRHTHVQPGLLPTEQKNKGGVRKLNNMEWENSFSSYWLALFLCQAFFVCVFDAVGASDLAVRTLCFRGLFDTMGIQQVFLYTKSIYLESNGKRLPEQSKSWPPPYIVSLPDIALFRLSHTLPCIRAVFCFSDHFLPSCISTSYASYPRGRGWAG